VSADFVLLRLSSVRDVDLQLFDFDYDLSWNGLFVSAEGAVYGRYGSRGPDSAESENTLDGLRHAMQAARERHQLGKRLIPPVTKKVRSANDYPEVQRMRADACVHCHHVHDFERARLRAANLWTLDSEWKYPPADTIGLTLDPRRGDRIVDVKAGSPADRGGLKPGDILQTVGGQPVASLADVRHALHHAAASGPLTIDYQRRGLVRAAKLDLDKGWRQHDISWRWSLRSLDPAPPWRGDDLDPDERRKLGLAPERLAVRQGSFLTVPARQAGLQTGDVIVGLDGKPLHLNLRQLNAHVRLYHRVGQEIVVNVLRAGNPVDIRLKLVTRQQLD
jgi:predicted metalloprotease with PDZ domain